MSDIDFTELDQRADEFESAKVDDVLRWAWENIGPCLALSTAFGSSGCVLIDLVARTVPELPIFTIDTGYLFAETLELKDRIQDRYGIEIESVAPDLTITEQDHKYGKDLFSTDSDHCCYMRKVEPLHRKLSGLDGWVASLRRDQGESRRNIRIVEPFPSRGDRLIAKLNPLACWTKKDVWDYILANDVPYNPLMDQGYPSLGCVPCTQAVVDGGDERSGRWAGQTKTECGIHLPLTVEPAPQEVAGSVAV